MRRTFLTAIALTTTIISLGSAFTVQAGTKNCINGSLQRKQYVISTGKINCKEDLEKILSELGNSKLNCPTVIIPGIIKPGNNKPDTDKPETNIPETSVPETTKPEMETPEVNVPETEVSETNKPEVEIPDTNVPEIGIPETSMPEVTTKAEEENQNVTYAQKVVNLVNKERTKAGLKVLTLDKKIEEAALVRAKEIEISFSHTRPNGSSFSTVLAEHGMNTRGSGENIAWGQISPEAVMDAWMNSDGHRANILNPNFTKIGVGYYRNSAGRNYWTQLFTY